MHHIYHFKNKLMHIGIGGLLILFLFLTTYRLGANTLWHDEAEVALLGKQILKTGIPTVVYDGKFLPISHQGDYHSDFAPYVFRLQTWLMFYAAAVGMYVFGSNAFGARIIFVLFGIITLPVMYLLCLEITKNKRLSQWATILLMFSAQYIVLIRHARYYAPVMFFSTLSMYIYIKYVVRRIVKRGVTTKKLFPPYLLFGISMASLFYTHYLSFYSLLFGFMSFYVFLFYKKRKKLTRAFFVSSLLPFLITCIILFVLTTPWLLLFSQHFQSATYSRADFIAGLITIVNKINRTVPIIVVLTGAYLLFKSTHKQAGAITKVFAFLWIIVSTIVFISLVTALRIPPSTGPEFRYVLSIYPLLFILLGYIVYRGFAVNRMAGFSLALLLTLTNVFAYPWEAISKEDYWPLPKQRLSIRSYLYEYISSELRLGYVGPAGAIIDLLRQESGPGDSVFISSEGISILFHLPDLTVDNDYSFWQKHKMKIQPEDLTQYDWVIFRQVCNIDCIFEKAGVPAVQSVLDRNFEKRILTIHDYIVDNREEIPYRLFSTPVFKPYVVIYERNF